MTGMHLLQLSTGGKEADSMARRKPIFMLRQTRFAALVWLESCLLGQDLADVQILSREKQSTWLSAMISGMLEIAFSTAARGMERPVRLRELLDGAHNRGVG